MLFWRDIIKNLQQLIHSKKYHCAVDEESDIAGEAEDKCLF